MNIRLHANATTTPKQRGHIQESDKSVRELAEEFGVSETTVCRWKNRDDVYDLSSRPHHLQTTLTPEQEAIIVELRKALLLPLDDLLLVTHEFINPKCSRSGLARCLRRHNLTPLCNLIPDDGTEETPKSFRDYLPGYLHVDLKYLPQMPDESKRSYLFVAIDRATRWVYLEIFANKSAESAKRFLENLIEACPINIRIILTDNGKEFADRFCRNWKRISTDDHRFDKVCQAHRIEYRLIKPGCPQTNGMVKSFNRRIEKILKTTQFTSSNDLQKTSIAKPTTITLPSEPLTIEHRWKRCSTTTSQILTV